MLYTPADRDYPMTTHPLSLFFLPLPSPLLSSPLLSPFLSSLPLFSRSLESERRNVVCPEKGEKRKKKKKKKEKGKEKEKKKKNSL